MRICKTCLLTAALAIALLLAAVLPSLANPELEALAKDIVAATASEDRAAVEKRYEPDLGAAIKAASENTDELILDFDWMTNSQDPDYQGIKSTIAYLINETSPTQAFIRVTFSQFDNPSTVDYHVRKAAGGWLIHDVVYPNDDFGLRKALKLID
jgi:hypothetical protein